MKSDQPTPPDGEKEKGRGSATHDPNELNHYWKMATYRTRIGEIETKLMEMRDELEAPVALYLEKMKLEKELDQLSQNNHFQDNLTNMGLKEDEQVQSAASCHPKVTLVTRLKLVMDILVGVKQICPTQDQARAIYTIETRELPVVAANLQESQTRTLKTDAPLNRVGPLQLVRDMDRADQPGHPDQSVLQWDVVLV